MLQSALTSRQPFGVTVRYGTQAAFLRSYTAFPMHSSCHISQHIHRTKIIVGSEGCKSLCIDLFLHFFLVDHEIGWNPTYTDIFFCH